jgi:hypothetical protein
MTETVPTPPPPPRKRILVFVLVPVLALLGLGGYCTGEPTPPLRKLSRIKTISSHRCAPP